MARKVFKEGIPENLPEFEEPCPICLLTKVTKITPCLTTDTSKSSSGFILHIYFDFPMLKESVDLS